MSVESIPTLIETFHNYRINRGVTQENLCFQLDDFSKALARDQALRIEITTAFPSIWESISELWATIADSLDNLVSRDLTLSLSRFTRNLVAGIPSNQDQAFINEPRIRVILHHLTSFSQLEDSDLYPVTRMLVQTVSNLVTLNDALATRLWTVYTTLPEDQNILMRLLASPDTRTVIATLVLILNCTNSEEERLTRLTSPMAIRIVVRLLDRTEEWVDRDEEQREDNEAFTIAYRIFEALLGKGLGTTLYHALAIEDEPVTPHQTTFLKIIDSNLRNQDGSYINSGSTGNSYLFLTDSFFDLCTYSQHAIRRSLSMESYLPSGKTGDLSTSPAGEIEVPDETLKELDLRLPKVAAALILLAQSLTTICLEQEKNREAGKQECAVYDIVVAATQAKGFVENLVETLRLVDRFLPRIVFGQAAPPPGDTNVLQAGAIDTAGFTYLKRDLVRLLGTICHGRKAIQNRIRECGGIQVVMNLCVIDERNPYMQEHALFALHNLLYHNPENQAVVEAMKPQL